MRAVAERDNSLEGLAPNHESGQESDQVSGQQSGPSKAEKPDDKPDKKLAVETGEGLEGESEQQADDAELVDAARAGDQLAFERLYRRHQGRTMALCWRMCGGNDTLAAELVQDAFVRAWQKLHLFRGEAKFTTWLHRLTVNVVLSDRRIRMRQVAREQPLESAPEAGMTPSLGLDADLEAAIAKLPERARTVLVLHDVEGMKHTEIAELADMAVGTSKAQLHRARRLLREWLNE
ncbi:MAG: sigma-70 family RNA polymerase sigma factor [Pseudomonadota bacterium]